MDVTKKFMTSSSAKDGEFDTSTSTSAPATASSTPSLVKVFTPGLESRGRGVVTVGVELLDQLGPDESGSADDDDLHESTSLSGLE